jgi:hypothetical protein
MAYQHTVPGGVFPGHDYEEFTERKKRRLRRLGAVFIVAAAVLIGWVLLERWMHPVGTVPVPEYEHSGR